MKRITQILIIMALLVIPIQFQVTGHFVTPTVNHMNNETNESISLSQIDTLQGAFSRPILVSVSNTTGTSQSDEILAARGRNDSLGEGAIHEMGIYQNVTVQYKVVNGDENTTIKLYLDVPASNYSLSLTGNENESIVMDWVSAATELINVTLPYENDPFNEIQFVNVSIYKAEFNMTEDFVRYFAAISESNRETLSAPFNFITTSNYWRTNSEDEFYIQNEDVLINLIANNSNSDVYGIAYRTNSFGDYTNVNFTNPGAVTDYNETLNLGEFPIGTTLEWKSYAYVTDTVNNTLRYIERVDYKFVKVEDGTPSISSSLTADDERAVQINSTFYSMTSKVNITLNASVVKGIITQFNLTLGENSSIIPAIGNVSTSGEQLNFIYDFASEGTYDVVLMAETDKNIQINDTYTIIIDQTIPNVTLNAPKGSPNIDTTSGRVMFTFNFNDTLSGVRFAILDFGDNSSVQVNGLDQISHHYLKLDQLYTVTLTIIDFAGNENVEILTFALNTEDIDRTTAPTLEIWLLLIAVVVLIAVYVNRERLPKIFNR